MEKTGLAILKESVDSKKFVDGYDQFLELAMNFWENSLFIDLLDPFESQIINFVFGSIKGKLDKADLNILLSPDEMSHFQKSQRELVHIHRVSKEKGIRSLEVVNLIKNLSRDYYWLKNDYEKVEYLGNTYFSKELGKLLSGKNMVEEIARGLEKFEETRKRKAALITKYGIGKDSVRMLEFFNWVTTYRDDRKKYNQISNYILIKTIEKISIELGIAIELLRYALPHEIPLVIRKDKHLLSELEKRTVAGMMFIAGKTTKPEIISGPIVREYFAILEKTIAASEIKGATASPGKVIGTAKIILNQSDFSKMEDGDVIVASMTRPEYIPIMKRASAIVTDEGGITCHAAIVSRELSIPCITGTQVATNSLKDGDLIDVNADHGLVKIIRKAE